MYSPLFSIFSLIIQNEKNKNSADTKISGNQLNLMVEKRKIIDSKKATVRRISSTTFRITYLLCLEYEVMMFLEFEVVLNILEQF